MITSQSPSSWTSKLKFGKGSRLIKICGTSGLIEPTKINKSISLLTTQVNQYKW